MSRLSLLPFVQRQLDLAKAPISVRKELCPKMAMRWQQDLHRWETLPPLSTITMITTVPQRGRLTLMGLMLSIKTHSITCLVTPWSMTENGPNTGHFVQDLFPCDGSLLQVYCFNPSVLAEVCRQRLYTLPKDIMTRSASLINFSYHTRGLLNVSTPLYWY